MSWRWQVNNNPRQIGTLLTQQQQQQQQLPVRWLHEYQHQLTQAQLCQQLRLQQQQQQQLLQHVHQHPQFQYPLQRGVPSPWPDMSSSRTSQSMYSQAHTARRELYEDILPTRNIKITQSDNRHNGLYHEGKGNDFPLQEPRTQVFYPEQRRLLNGVHQAQTGLYDEFSPKRNVQQTTDNDYRCGLYYQELQNRFPHYDERLKNFHAVEEHKRLLDEQSNGLRRRMWRPQTPCPTFERQHPYHRSFRDRSVGPDQRWRRYRSKSVGPELGYQRKIDSEAREKRDIGDDKLFFKPNSRKSHSSCSDYADVGENRKNNTRYRNLWNTGPNLCDENRFKIKQNAHSETNQPSCRKRKGSISPDKDTSSVIGAIEKKRRTVCKPEKIKKIAHESSVIPNSDSTSSSTHKSPHVQENRVGNGSITGITRTVSYVAEETPPKSSSVERDVNDGSTTRNWQLTPLENVALNKSHTPFSGITRTVLNVHAERTHKAGERNHRLRSFREEEREDEKTLEEEEEEEDDDDEEEEEEDEDGGGGGGDYDDDNNENGGEDINTNKNVQSGRDVEERCVEHEIKINMDQQSTGECIDEIECTKEYLSKFGGEKEAQQQLHVPEYNSNVPVGRSLLKWTQGLRCRMCHQFFLEFEQAEQHCQTFEHYMNYVKRINELQCALNIDPMDAPKALELEKLLEDEPPLSVPPETYYRSEMCNGLL